MAVGVNIVTAANQWVVTFDGATATKTLPFTMWSGSPFIAQRMVWTSKAGAAGDEVIISDQIAAANIWYHAVSSAANFMTPQEWKRHRFGAAPFGAIIRTFGSGELVIYF